MYKIADLFAGIGGIALGFKKAGFEIAWANEIDSKACITYRENFDHPIYEEDIKILEPKSLEPVDIITAGFPCQAFSIAGLQKGFKDERGNTFFQILKFVEAYEPKVVLLENVKNLEGHDQGRTFQKITQEMKKRGYHIKHKVLNTCEYSDIPQNRERIYIVCFKDVHAHLAFNFPTKVMKQKAVSELLDDVAPENFYYKNTKYYSKLKEGMINKDSIYQWRRVYLRENKKGICPTLTANMGTGGHNVPLIYDSKDIRKLTPRECARLQGLPEKFMFPKELSNSALYKQIGNSVSMPIIYRIAKNIMEALLLSEKNEKEKIVNQHEYKTLVA